MRLNPIAAFKNPATRVRAVIWTGITFMMFIILWAVMLTGTSTYWFCTSPCHIVHVDNTAAYNESTHTKVACVACHEPVNANPITLTLLKMEVAPDVIETVNRTFSLPLNEFSHVALEMDDDQCLQCHSTVNRTYTPDVGLLIDHDVHTKANIRCTTCHNRVAHPEETIDLVAEGNRKHDNWIGMDGCFRCHEQEAASDKTPTGECKACHPPQFELLPATHKNKKWFTLYGDSTAHAKAAKDESTSVLAARARQNKHLEDAGESHDELELHNAAGSLLPAAGVNNCYTCHKRAYCTDCHGVEMPHPANFTKDHGEQGFKLSRECGRCHARTAGEAKGTGFCNACHHPESTPGREWAYQHDTFVKKDGAEACMKCHEDSQCAYCHVNGPARFRELREEMWK